MSCGDASSNATGKCAAVHDRSTTRTRSLGDHLLAANRRRARPYHAEGIAGNERAYRGVPDSPVRAARCACLPATSLGAAIRQGWQESRPRRMTGRGNTPGMAQIAPKETAAGFEKRAPIRRSLLIGADDSDVARHVVTGTSAESNGLVDPRSEPAKRRRHTRRVTPLVPNVVHLNWVRIVWFWSCWAFACAGWLVVPGGVEGEVAQDFAGGGVDDADVEVGDEQDEGVPLNQLPRSGL